MTNFKDFPLNSSILRALEDMGFDTPTPIQKQAIPKILNGCDVLGTARTGTGKTGAFAIPMAQFLLDNHDATALILLPTRELAAQVFDNIKKIIKYNEDIKMALLIGGDSMEKQLNQLAKKPRIIIATPGRINDHIKNNGLYLKNVKFLVLDEVDRMLDMGFAPQIEDVIKNISKERITLLFSATFPSEIKKTAAKYLKNHERIKIGEPTDIALNIVQQNVETEKEEKFNELVNQLNKISGTVLVFVRTKHGAEKISKKLNKQEFKAEAIHGDLRQSKRTRVIDGFRNLKYQVLVATDIASRGIDIPHIANVINFDLPEVPEDYIHRIGRTARAGADGIAINLLSREDSGKWNAICRLLKYGEQEKINVKKAVKSLDKKPKKNFSKEEEKEKRPRKALKKDEAPKKEDIRKPKGMSFKDAKRKALKKANVDSYGFSKPERKKKVVKNKFNRNQRSFSSSNVTKKQRRK